MTQVKFAFQPPKVSGEDVKEKDEGDVEGGDDAVDEELENKDMIEDDLGGEEAEKAKHKDGEDEE